MADAPLIGRGEGAHNRARFARLIAGQRRLTVVTYTFGSLSVDGGARLISRAGSPVHLTRKAFDLLLLLLEQRPNAVSKEQMHARLWPDTFVADGSVQSLVSEIRRAIDDPAPTASWLATVHGIGYRFDGPASATGPRSAPLLRVHAAGWLIGTAIRVPLVPGPNIVGRSTDGEDDMDGDIDARTISRQHARISLGEVATIEDLDSKNGTWLDDERVSGPRNLADGARVRLGSVTFLFRLSRQPRSTEPAP
jgi:DNA-binding winged helix-turn-helix (wHTH) protein